MKTIASVFLAIAWAALPLACGGNGGDTDAGQDAGKDAVDGAEDSGSDMGPDEKTDAGGDQGGDEGADEGGDESQGIEPECTAGEQCTLHTDCCSCVALAQGEDPPNCEITGCPTDACTSAGVEPVGDPHCTAGRCVAGIDCDHTKVMCLVPIPLCDPGEIPSVIGACWGACVKASECAFVPNCTGCDPAFYVCVANVAHLTSYHCVDVPPECDQDRNCECMGENVCINSFYMCRDPGEQNQIHCDCPAC